MVVNEKKEQQKIGVCLINVRKIKPYIRIQEQFLNLKIELELKLFDWRLIKQ